MAEDSRVQRAATELRRASLVPVMMFVNQVELNRTIRANVTKAKVEAKDSRRRTKVISHHKVACHRAQDDVKQTWNKVNSFT